MVATATRADNNRKAMARKSRESTLASNEVGKLPPLRAKRLHEKCRHDLLLFLQKCFPKSTGLKPFSDEQKQAIQNLQDAILNGGQMVQAWPRGFGKTTITTRAALWAILYGHTRYVIVYSAREKLALSIVKSMQSELRNNEELFRLFPGAISCIRHLNNSAQRCRTQTCDGVSTSPEWGKDRIRLPALPDYVGSGCIVESKAIDSSRGANETKDDGSVDRPDLVLFDDPQTNVGARNHETVNKVIEAIEAAILGGGHAEGITAIINCTVIEEDDVAEHYLNNPEWVRVRFVMMKSMPDRMDLWDKYAEIKRDFAAGSMASEIKARKKALEFYRGNRREMEKGAEPTWKWCYAWDQSTVKIKNKCEASAVQHAMNLYYKHGAEFFEKECQNNPRAKDDKKRRLKWTDIAAKRIKLPPNVCPDGSLFITGHIDVHESVLCYGLIAWNKNFGGHVIRWSVWPDQTQHLYRFAKAPRKLMDVAPEGSDESAAIYHGLGEVFDDVFGMDYYDESGGIVDVEGLGVDAGFNGDVVRDAIKNSAYRPLLFPMFSRGISAKKAPLSEWNLQPGDKRGEEWIYRRPAKKIMKQFTPDANYWKTFAADAWRFPIGHRHALTMHDGDVASVKMFCSQCVAERPERVQHETRVVDEWELPPNKPDNHAGDNIYNAAVIASYRGLHRSPEVKLQRRKRRSRKVSYG